MDEKEEKIRQIYFSMQKNYGEARENRHKAREAGDALAVEYYKGECAAYSEGMHDITMILDMLRIDTSAR